MSVHPDVPDLVHRALRTACSRGFIQATRTETGRLLAALAATRTGTIAECGTGAGVGAAWLRSGAPSETRVITAELDPELAKAACETFADDAIEIYQGDWRRLCAFAPFSLLFLDAGSAKHADLDQVIELVDAGGIIVIDDLVPCHSWPPMERGSIDAMRLDWLSDPRLASVETLVAEDTAVLMAVRRG